jgi:outer membrane usher protein
MAVLGDYGIVSANVVASRSDAGGEGHTELATYSYGGPDLSASLVAFRQSREFGTGAVAGISLAPGRPRERIGGGFGTSIGPQRTLTVDASRGRTWDGPADSIIAVRIAQGFENGASLSLAAVRRDDGTARGTDIAVSLSIPLGRGITFNAATEQRAAKGSRQTATASGPVPAGEGFGWRVDAEREAGLVGAGGFVQDNQPFATITGAARRLDSRGAGASTGTDLRFAGAVVGIGERVFLTRPIAQSFALAEVPGVPGVRMYQNSQLIGRTDAAGQLLVPALGGYGVNQVSLDDRDVPMDRELKEVRREVVPRDFVGTVLSFEAKRVSALGGILVATVGGQPVRVVSAELTVRGGKAERTAITGPDGDFYLDDLEPGRYEIEALNRRLNCRAEVTLAEGKVPFVDLGEVRCHAMAK